MIGAKFLDLILTRSPCAIGIPRSPSILPDVISVAPANCATLNFRISKLPSYSDASIATSFNCSPFNWSRLIFNNTFASNPANADIPLNGLIDSAFLVFCLPAVALSPFEFVDTISGFDFEGMGIYASAFIWSSVKLAPNPSRDRNATVAAPVNLELSNLRFRLWTWISFGVSIIALLKSTLRKRSFGMFGTLTPNHSVIFWRSFVWASIFPKNWGAPFGVDKSPYSVTSEPPGNCA